MTTGKYCIIRTHSAGVFCGVVARREWKEATIIDSRRIWRWETDASEDLPAKRLSCHELAIHGVHDTLGAISETLPGEHVLTEVVEVLECTEKAERQLRTTRPRAQ